MPWTLRDQVAIAGIGQTAFARHGQSGRTAFALALEATLGACDDAGVSPDEIDGFVTYGAETTDPYTLAQTLGIDSTSYMDRYPGGGESLAGIIHHAAMAIAAGAATTVLAYRSLSGRLIRGSGDIASAAHDNAGFRRSFLAPFGAFVPYQYYAIQARRHMIDYGTTTRQFGAYAVVLNENAQRNPDAIHHGRPITVEDHENSRMIASPYRVYDCVQEADGAGAVIVVSAERAADLRQRPVYLLGAAEGSGPADQMYNQLRHQSRWNTAGLQEVAEVLYQRAGIGPDDIDVAQIFETFTGQGIMAHRGRRVLRARRGRPLRRERRGVVAERVGAHQHVWWRPLRGVHPRVQHPAGGCPADARHVDEPGRRRGDLPGDLWALGHAVERADPPQPMRSRE